MSKVSNVFTRSIEESMKLREKASKITESKKTKKLEDEDDEYLAVVDPDEDYTDMIIDPEVDPESDEVAEPEDHVGQLVYQCDICGAAFFSDKAIDDGVCQLCGEETEPKLIGVVAPIEDITDEGEVEIDDSEDLVVDVEEEPAEEDPEEDPDGEVEESCNECDGCGCDKHDRRVPGHEDEDIFFDESKMNKMLTKFATENYKNIKNIVVSKVVLKASGKMMIECKINYKSGKVGSTKFITEKINMSAKKFKIKMTESGVFKITAPIIVEGVHVGKNISFNKMTYNFITESKGNKYKVCGTIKG